MRAFSRDFLSILLAGIIAAYMSSGPEILRGQHEDLHGMANRQLLKEIDLTNAFSFDPSKGEKGQIRYVLEEPALLTIKVLRKKTRELYLATIVNWEYRGIGPHVEEWDGRSYQGDPVDLSQVIYLLDSEPMSDFAPGTMTQGVEYQEGAPQEEALHAIRFGHTHAKHSLSAEEIPVLNITYPGEGDVLAGLTTIEAAMDRKARGYGDRYGYGVRFYLDTELIAEDFYKPESGGNFSYSWDTTAFEDGKHLLYLGVCDHNEHVTSRAVEVTIKNGE